MYFTFTARQAMITCYYYARARGKIARDLIPATMRATAQMAEVLASTADDLQMILICDAQYTPEEYRGRVGWGHSSVIDAVRLTLAAGVRRLALFHHDPERDDSAVDALLEAARTEVARRGGEAECLAAAEGMELAI